MIAQVRAETPSLRRRLLIGASIGSMLLAGVVHAQEGRGRGGAANPADAAVRAAQAQAARAAQTSSASQRAVAAFRRAANGRSAMQAAQAAARAAAQAAQSNIPNGLGQGGLQVADGVALDPGLWIGAKGPTQTTGADGRTAVAVDQTQQQAILNWNSFNVGRETDLTFNQQGADWVVLNRVTDASADPTRILGSIKAQGTVLILNRNGVIFSGTSQVNVRNLVASSAGLSNDQFLTRGIYSSLANGDYLASFTDAGGAISVEAGARIATNTPTSVTAGGGFVLLMGTEVTNAGSITTPRGQTQLAAGDDFIVRRGFGTTENPYSTTRGNEVRGLIEAGSTRGAVTNAGQIEAGQGDITLAGRTVRQDGVMVATSSVNQRGTIHLLNSASDAEGSVTLGEDSLTLILPELDSKDTALNGQRDALIAASDKANLNRFSTTTGGFDDRSLLADSQDQGRVEIVTGGDVVFDGGSQTLANGGQVAVQATAGRITVKDGASIDVSGTMGVALDMASNSIQVNVQGNELRDSPDNRDSNALKNQNVWIDVRDLILLPTGTGGYDGDRWYTPGGLFEVGGYLANTAHGIGEWTAVGGAITLAANEVVAETGSVFDISGGSLDYAAGYVRSSRMLGIDGRMYDVRNAPAGMTFVGVGNAFVRKHERWGSQYDEVYNNRLFSRGTTMRWEDGYTVGRDAGRLILSTPTAVMEANILADVVNGERQTQARVDGVTDGYQLGQHTVAQAGSLAIGNYVAMGRETPFNTDVRIDDVATITGDTIPQDRTNTVWLDASHLNAQGLGGLTITTGAAVTVDRALTLATGGALDITAPVVNLNAGVTARSGSIRVGNVFTPAGVDRNPLVLTQNGAANVTVGQGAVLDMRGLWVNDTSGHALGLGHLDGGAVSLNSTGDVVMSAGSAIDVSSGGAVVELGAFKGGQGGDVTLRAGYEGGTVGAPARLLMNGDIRGHGVAGGGALTVQAENIQIGGTAASDDNTLVLADDVFDKGFSAYEAFGNSSLTVADGATLNVVMPVLRLTDAGLTLETGADPANGLELWTPPLYQEDPVNGVLGQRAGASLTFRAGGVVDTLADTARIALTIGRGAVVSVDPGQSIALLSGGQTTIHGRLNAWGGAIEVGATEVAVRNYSDPISTLLPDKSIWIGEDGVLDVAGRAATAVDIRGGRYGVVAQGGQITIGDRIDESLGGLSLGAFVVVREGALLDASGAQATLDLSGRPDTQVASNGGVISLATSGGLYLHGDFKASAGGAGAAGGTLELSMESVLVSIDNPIDRQSQARELVITQNRADLDVFGDDTPEQGAARFVHGHGAISGDQITEGGFGDLILGVKGQISFVGDLDLDLSQSVRLYAASLALGEDAEADADISITAPYIRLAGVKAQVTQQPGVTEAVVTGASSRESEARLTLNAHLLDVRDLIGFGAGGTLPRTGGAVPYDRRGFADVALNSSGDLRFLRQTGDNNGTRLTTADGLTLTAAQIYPATHALATVVADRIDIGRSTTAAPALPYSAFGQLGLLGKVVNQGGVVRAPLGIVTLGQVNGFEGGQGSPEVNLLAGSVTSVSGSGLVMPYGGTVDGIVYTYDGVKLSDSLLGIQPINAAVTINGQSVDVAQGAVIDVSGGGTLTGAGFVSGRGGSVDVLDTALANANPGYAFSSGASSVYAIVPGHVGYAPVSPEAGAGDPMIGQQITLEAGVGGLPAGVYTLMPSTYALAPGAFRVEIAATTDPRGAGASAAVGNGSDVVAGRLGLANTGVLESLSRQVIVTSGDVVRRYSLYNETGFSAFAIADASRLGVPRIRLPGDAHGLMVNFATNRTDRSAFSFLGEFRNAPVKDGWGGEVNLTTGTRGSIEIVKTGVDATADFAGVTVNDADINRLNAGRLLIGGRTQTVYGQAGNYVNFASDVGNVVVRSGANLSASEIFLVSGIGTGDFGITVEQGAVLNTLGRGTVGQDSRDGFIYVPLNHSVFAVSNSYLTMLAPRPNDDSGFGPGRIDIGGCQSVCSGVTQLYSEGTIVAATDKAFTLDNAVRFGTRNLTLAVGGINIGTEASLADAAADGILPAGLELNQSVLERLLRGDTSTGAPALETLVLTARDSVNLFGTVTLDTLDPVTGKSLLSNLVLTSGGIYGHGTSSDVATIRTANFIWNGTVDAAPAVMAGGAGTGAGAFNVEAQRIEFGFGQDAVAAGRTYDRLALGFATVNLTASDRVTGNHAGSLKVYQTQGAYTPGVGYAYQGGALNITAPLITGEAGSVNAITVGGAVSLAGAGSAAAISDLGGTLSIRGASLNVNTAITLPSGKLTLGADGDVVLGDAARIDMSGRELTFFDVKKYSWGGDVTLESRTGDILQSAGSSINLSAANNYAGALRAVALDADAGRVDLLGGITATTSGLYDAGGTIVPYRAGSVELRGTSLGDFAALNTRLNTGGVFGGRYFQITQGDLTIGNEVRASDVGVSLDNGQLTVNGTIDASGAQVGRIRLFASDGLTLTGTAVLDAHGELLRADSYGKIIDSPNRAIVELGSGAGTLTLASGSRIDLRHGVGSPNDGVARGTLELNAPRLGADDIAIDAGGVLTIQGARSIAVNAMRTYSGGDIPFGTDTTATGRPYQVIDQAWLNDRHGESETFINAALGNGWLMQGKLAGLNNATYRDVLHVRPGVEIATEGDLVVNGDLDLSGHRYAGINPNFQQTAVYGSGEVGRLTLRAGGDLSVYGSITDGFTPPPEAMPEEDGWVLLPGEQMFNADVIVPRAGIELQPGTTYPVGQTLNYDLPMAGKPIALGTRLPVATTLTADVNLPADIILSAAIRNPDGSVAYAAGTRMPAGVTLTSGMTLDAGTLLPVAIEIGAVVWPKGIPLPSRPADTVTGDFVDFVALDTALVLPMGGLIPAGSKVELGAGVDSIKLRGGDGKGRSWALAQMLPEGSQSWSLGLVAGADLGAADERLTVPNVEHGRLMLADLHYGMTGRAVIGGARTELTTAGSIDLLGTDAYGGLTEDELNERFLVDFGLTFAELFGTTFADACTWGASYCETIGGGGLGLTEDGARDLIGDSSYAGLTLAQIDERLMAEYGLDFLGLQGVSFEDACTWGDYCQMVGSGPVTYEYTPATTALSVIRTGTGDLDLVSGGDLSVQSLYGVYTAGVSSLPLADSLAGGFNTPRPTSTGDNILKGAGHEQYVDGGEQSLYRAWYPDLGGNLSVAVGGNLTGDLVGTKRDSFGVGVPQFASSDVSNWLWRQSSTQDVGGATAWWINFGTYATAGELTGTVGFTGFGTLGGGDLDVRVAGDAGTLSRRGSDSSIRATRSQGLVLAVGSTGRVVDGQLVQTGGGDMDVRIGGGLNPELDARAYYDSGARRLLSNRQDMAGAFVNLRGTMQVDAGAIGGIETVTGDNAVYQDARETRAYDPFSPTMASATGGILIAPGDATVRLNTRGDLVLASAVDAGRVNQRNPGAYSIETPNGLETGTGGAAAWFTLWTDRTAIDLFSAGGNMTPITALAEMNITGNTPSPYASEGAPSDGRFVYPSILRATAAGGSLFYGASGVYDAQSGSTTNPRYSLVLAPGGNGQLEFLAADSLYSGGYVVSPSGADATTVATPFNPAVGVYGRYNFEYKYAGPGLNYTVFGAGGMMPLFAFGPNTATGSNAGAPAPARFYARDGDLVGVRSGAVLTLGLSGRTLYEGGRPVWMQAGRDIVNSGTPVGVVDELSPGFNILFDNSRSNLFVHTRESDVSVVSAGRDILFSSFNVAGPGTLEVSAGRNIQMEDRATLTSLGPIALGDARPGASIVMAAGMTGMDFAAIRDRYLDPANLADSDFPLVHPTNEGKVAQVYDKELIDWLGDVYGFNGTVAEALAYFDALAPEQQRVFLRQVYFAETREGGREYNDADGPRFASYLRGRQMIATLFPDKGEDGKDIARAGDIIMFGGSGVRTNFGGDIQMLVPGGQIVAGVQGQVPPATSGIVTQGAGDIQLFSEGSLLLGLSRVMTTFGGDIFAWSEEGDINAGRGSKTTVVYTPPKRTYDNYGNVALAPQVPSSGAGIATLNPIPEILPGDVDLIAPLGTIDAGEAGIRVSGNVNLAALQVLNAANIQVDGDAKGIPLPPVVNTGALTAASSATNAVVAEATRLAEKARPIRSDLPAIITSRFLGFGEE